ncbi:MAG: succinate dehydrogenase, hydrophobic membrane anchor protein [Proteobacteria bacterium]|nr:MAG: succinate dehydrogenase, hydrophobic membrane anchor protein [Pseudomonadota bacterium]
MSIVTPLKKARGLGSAKEGTHHWWMQRVTAIALIPLILWFLYSIIALNGEPYEVALNHFISPFNAAIASLFILAAFYHASLGLQVVIEDYIHHETRKLAALIGMKFFLAVTGATSIFAILRAAFGN